MIKIDVVPEVAFEPLRTDWCVPYNPSYIWLTWPFVEGGAGSCVNTLPCNHNGAFKLLKMFLYSTSGSLKEYLLSGFLGVNTMHVTAWVCMSPSVCGWMHACASLCKCVHLAAHVLSMNQVLWAVVNFFTLNTLLTKTLCFHDLPFQCVFLVKCTHPEAVWSTSHPWELSDVSVLVPMMRRVRKRQFHCLLSFSCYISRWQHLSRRHCCYYCYFLCAHLVLCYCLHFVVCVCGCMRQL